METMILPFKNRSSRYERRKAAGHNVPKAGTLRVISYCADCGDGFDNESPCRGAARKLESQSEIRRLGLWDLEAELRREGRWQEEEGIRTLG